jgi:hypothetical protein
MKTLQEAIDSRHSVRHYLRRPLTPAEVQALREKIEALRAETGLGIELVLNEPKGFSGLLAYGAFSGVENYIVLASRSRSAEVDELIGRSGEELVLLAEQMGLGTCWAGLSYRKVAGAFSLKPGERVVCMIALGHPDDPGRKLRRKSVEQVSNAGQQTPQWFVRGVEAALKAPTAINQQKFRFEYPGATTEGGEPVVRASRQFSLVGYTAIDLGIAKLHFEIGAGTAFSWE